MTEAQNITINDVPQEISDDVQRIIEKVSAAITGERLDTSLTALTIMTASVLKSPSFNEQQQKAGALFLLSMASQLTVDVGVSDTEIMSAMVQPTFYGDQQNAEAQPS